MAKKKNKPGFMLLALECLKNGVDSIYRTVAKYDTVKECPKPREDFGITSLTEEEKQEVRDLLMEQADTSEEDIEEMGFVGMVEDQLGDFLNSDFKVTADDHKLVGNEILMASKSFILISIDDNGGIQYQMDLREASPVDTTGFQLTCTQLAEDLYNRITRTSAVEEDENEDDEGIL